MDGEALPVCDSEGLYVGNVLDAIRARNGPALVALLAHASGPTIGGMTEAKNPQDKCVECGHPRSSHHEYSTPPCLGFAEAGQPAVACSCLEFAEPERSSRRR